MTRDSDVDNLRTTWGPRPEVLWITGGLTVGFIVAAVFFGSSGDGPGALLVGAVALLTLLGTVTGVVVRPRLAADGAGIEVRSLGRHLHARWGAVNATVATTRRLGRDVKTLEIEIDDDLIVLGRLELGAHPDDVHAVLERLQQAGGQAT